MKININNYEQINIYNENGVIFSTIRGGFERATIKDGKAQTHYNNTVYEIELPIDSIRNARKIDLTKNDVFNISYMPKGRYDIRNGKAIYIPTKYITVENIGEYLSIETSGEKDFLTIYKFTFANPQTISEPQFERIICDNYTLSENERFSSGCGKDKNHACISTFDTSENTFYKKSGRPAEKGIIKRYYADIVYNSFLVKSDYYTRTEKDAARIEREKIAEIINSCLYNKTVSHYDVEKIMEKLNISLSEDLTK